MSKTLSKLQVYLIFICSLLITGCNGREKLIGTVGEPVDLGLSVHWADHNLGAVCMSDSGVPLTVTTKWRRKKVVDSARRMWGRGWHVPTIAQMRELIDECDWRSHEENGVGGFKVTGPNGNCIFLPGYTDIRNLDYWTSEADAEHAPFVAFMYMNSSYLGMSYSEISEMKHIRPVTHNRDYHKIAREDRIRDPVLLEKEAQQKKARENLQKAMENINSGSGTATGFQEKNMSDTLGICYLDTAATISLTKTTLDRMDNVYYRLSYTQGDTITLSDMDDIVTLRFSGLLAFVIDAVAELDDAQYTVIYNNGKQLRTGLEKVGAGETCQSRVFYADKDRVTSISLWAAGNVPVRLTRLRVFHTLVIGE